MAEGYVIGVDLGGTKLLAGAVGADLSVIHRTNRPVYGLSQDELVQMVADAVDEIRTAVGADDRGDRVRHPVHVRFAHRNGRAGGQRAAQGHRVRRRDGRAAAACRCVVDNDANCHTVCESRIGIAQGATEVALLTLGTGIGGGLLLRGEIYRGWINGGAEMGHMVVEMNGRPCQGNCPNWGCLESVASGSALVREASLAVARRPDTELGPRAGGGPRADRPADHRAGHRRAIRSRAARSRRSAARSASGIVEPRQHLQPAGRRDRRRRDRGGRAAAGARARGDAGARARARRRTSCASRPRASGPRRG